MAYFAAEPNTAVTFLNAFSNLAALNHDATVFTQQTVNGFTAVLGGQVAIVVTGNGFTYEGPLPADGAITTLLLKQGGVTIGTLSGLAVDYSDFVANLEAHGVSAAMEQLLQYSDDITGSSLNDVLFGKAGNDVIHGLDGADRLYGDESADTLYGGNQNDQLFGGAGNDHLYGGEGDDALYGGFGTDTIDGGSGNDTVYFGADTAAVRVTLDGANPATVQAGIFQRGTVKNVESVVGGSGDDDLTGDAGQNFLSGGNGNDILGGKAGDDRLLGSFGDDSLNGGSGNDWLQGNAGRDHLDGGLGVDTMEGGSGDDTYVVDYIGDVVIEAAGGGVDSVEAAVSYTLASNVENLTLTGHLAIDATGNGLTNTLIGNAAANRLDGKGGSDVMKGGEGNDTYVVDHVHDSVVEKAGEGTDTVESSVSFKLGAEVENLTLVGTEDLAGTGNGLANVLVGNAGANVLSGGFGKDFLTGGVGNDTFVFDAKLGKANADHITDFSVGDVIGLDADVFKKVNDHGALKAKFFAAGHADDGNDHIISKHGKLFYDPDGNGHKHGKLFAKLDGGAHVDAHDFLIA